MICGQINALENKPGIAFTSTSSMHCGQETTLFSLITFMLHHGMVVAGTPYSIDELNKTKSGGTPYGPLMLKILIPQVI